MRNLILALILPFVFLSCSKSPADGVYNLEIYANGDVHGSFFGRPSLSQVSSFLNGRREAAGKENVTAIDLGDHIHGNNSTYYYNYIHNYEPGEKHLFSRIARYIGYDAIVAGNHDIETGRELFCKVKDEMGIPYLAANVIDAETQVPFFTPYTIISKSGVKIAVIGLTTPEVKKWLGKEKIEGLDILPVKECAVRFLEEVKENHSPHLIFLAVHAGSGNGKEDDIENPCRYLASTLDGIDGVLAAHDHIPFIGKEFNGKDSVLVVNSGPYAKFLQGIKITLEFKDGEIIGKKIEAELVDMGEMDSDAEYSAEFAADSINIERFSTGKLGSMDMPVEPGLIFDGPCLYSNLIHYVQLKETSSKVSFVSPTKFNGIIPAGDICYNDVLKLYPFENILYKVNMTGGQIRNYLELSYSNWKSKPVAYDCAGGIIYTVDFKKPLGERVTIISFVDGTPFDENCTYPVAMASYRANGGGDLLLEATGLHLEQLEGIVIQKYSPVRDLLCKFFLNEKKTAASLAAVSEWSIIR